MEQQGDLFHRTLRENLTYLSPAAKHEMDAAIAMLGLADVIGSLPKGYNTIAGGTCQQLFRPSLSLTLPDRGNQL